VLFSEKLRFVGYSASSEGYRLYDEKTRQAKVRRDVVFNETYFSLSEVYVVQEKVVKPTEAEVVDVGLSLIKNETHRAARRTNASFRKAEIPTCKIWL